MGVGMGVQAYVCACGCGRCGLVPAADLDMANASGEGRRGGREGTAPCTKPHPGASCTAHAHPHRCAAS